MTDDAAGHPNRRSVIPDDNPDDLTPVKKGWSRRRKVLLGLGGTVLTVVLVLAAAVGIFYTRTDVPRPDQINTSQVSTITYSDGHTVMAKVGARNRTSVRLNQVPDGVKDAVLSAEDRNFYHESGISVRGIVRAAWTDVRGGDVQGGSTITQQYVKNAFLTQRRTVSRKLTEIAIATKLAHKYSKDQVLEWYLNAIYFGRGAYGIQAAALTYFGTSVTHLSTEQGAVLAASIRSPALYDPANHPGAAHARWQFVMSGLVKMGGLTADQAAGMRYPAVQPIRPNPLNRLSGPSGYIVTQVKDELAKAGFDEAELNRDGVKVVTTIAPRAQHAAEQSVHQTFAGQPAYLRQALVSIDPASGKVLAYYGGSSGFGFDYAQAWRQPGSSFKPYVLATALNRTQVGQGDVTDDTEFPGPAQQEIGGVLVHNSNGESCSRCTLREAMTKSLNTVYYALGLQVGPRAVAETAHLAGIPARRTDTHTPTLQSSGGRVEGGISIGQYEVRPIDQASGYATLAAGGVWHQPYFVEKVVDSKGQVLYSHHAKERRVFTKAVCSDVTYAMENVASFSHDALAGDRQSAAKTGTAQLGETENNKDAWMVGFTPRVSTAVWVGSDTSRPLVDKGGHIVYGADLPGKAWQAFLDMYLAGTPTQDLPGEPVVLGLNDSPPTSTYSAPPVTSAPPTAAPPPTAPPTTAPPTTSPPTSAPPTTAPPTSAPPSSPPRVTPSPPKTPPPTQAPPTAPTR